ncbi:MAG: glycoside hydrolase family 113 [Bradymonadia bacterium]
MAQISPYPTPTPAPWPATGFQRGMVYSSWDGSYPHREAWSEHLDRFEQLGITWLEVMTFAEQPDINAPQIRTMPPSRWPSAFVTEARARGFKILLKPHVWSRQFYDGSKRWRGSIQLPDDAAYAQWFAQYEQFILAEARLAAQHGVEMFSVGLEYVEITRTQGPRWRNLVKKIRAVYPGLLTYSADGNHEAAHVDFWDTLDVIGVNAYFQISKTPSPTLEIMRQGWQPHVQRLKALSEKWARPIVFTEAGFASTADAPVQPWQWPSKTAAPDLETQRRGYESLFEACTGQKWCQGVFLWKWYEVPEKDTPHGVDYTPRDKPAEHVLKRWYRRESQ